LKLERCAISEKTNQDLSAAPGSALLFQSALYVAKGLADARLLLSVRCQRPVVNWFALRERPRKLDPDVEESSARRPVRLMALALCEPNPPDYEARNSPLFIFSEFLSSYSFFKKMKINEINLKFNRKKNKKKEDFE